MTAAILTLAVLAVLLLVALIYLGYRNRRLVDYQINLSLNQHARVMSRELARGGTTGTVRTDIIGSVTTTANRLHSVILATESILLQTVRPERIVIYLSDRIDPATLPAGIPALAPHGVEVRFVEDVGPHTKLLYALRDFPDHSILTFDDDIYYPPNAVEGMVAIAAIAPGAIVGNWVRKLRFGPNGRLLRARSGKLVTPKTLAREIEPAGRPLQIGFDLFPYGTGGILYPPHCMDERVFDIAAFQRLCPTEDDVWFKAMSLLNGSPVAAAPLGHTPKHHAIAGSQRIALRHINYAGPSGATQSQIRAVFEQYNLYPALKNNTNTSLT